ncbi:hypothetical protein [Streptomyces sp. NPDC048419]|uniref:hypothetical protein n=1 Tax=Streptomyces sp. NPDC048419 TaxID=3365547 RepID=UPI0037159817
MDAVSAIGRSRGAGSTQMWISLRVAADVLPLLVNACSAACVSALPSGAEDYVQLPHTGGRVKQPPSDWE